MTGYSHTITADGGMQSASLSLVGTVDEMEAWLSDGLNRHVEVYSPDQVLVFEGFVDQITYSAGTLTATRGPLMNIANRISVVYTPILSDDEDPPVTGTQTTTEIVDNETSQDKYGIVEQVFSAGTLYPDSAEALRDAYLEEIAWPETSETIGIGSTSEPSVELSILGYVSRLNTYITQDTTTQSIQISDPDGTGKLQQLIADDPNGIFPADYTGMEENNLLAQQYENENRTGWAAMQELVELGNDTDNTRMTLGVYAGRRVVYATIPTDVEYEHRIADRAMRVERYGTGHEVRPWDVLPARWTFLPDYMVGRQVPVDRRQDPRYIFIESVSFSAPYNVDLTGSKVGTIRQLLAKQGMWGS